MRSLSCMPACKTPSGCPSGSGVKTARRCPRESRECGKHSRFSREALLVLGALILSCSCYGTTLFTVADFGLTPEQIDHLPRVTLSTGKEAVLLDDIILDPERFREKCAYYGTKWPHGIVYYDFDSNVTSVNRQRWIDAATEWSSVADVSFIARNTQTDYVYVRSNSSSNSSWPGVMGGKQDMLIASWDSKFIICHEIGHALGLGHEHQRSDRDSYIVVYTSNVIADKQDQFVKLTTTNYGLYDFDSVMHYSKSAFSGNGQDTMEPLSSYSQYLNTMGQRTHLSSLDKSGMAALYQGARWHPNGNLLNYSGASYVLQSGYLRHIPDTATYWDLFDWDGIWGPEHEIGISKAELDGCNTGWDIGTRAREERIWKTSTSNTIWLVQRNFCPGIPLPGQTGGDPEAVHWCKRAFSSPSVYHGKNLTGEQVGHAYGAYTLVSQIQIDQIPQGPMIKTPYPEGTLLKTATNNAVYVISEGYRRALSSSDAFQALGYNWGNVVVVSDTEMNRIDISPKPAIDLNQVLYGSYDVATGAEMPPLVVQATQQHGENYRAGQNVTVKFYSDQTDDSKITVRFSADGGDTASVIPLARVPGNSGAAREISWTIPPVQSNNCIVSVTASGNNGTQGYDFSQIPFVIQSSTPGNPPDSPTLNGPSSSNSGNYTLQWTSVTGAVSYTLQEAYDPGFSSPFTICSGSNLSAYVSGRASGTHWYRVKASNAFGDSAWSNTLSVYTYIDVYPGEVTNVSPPDGASNQGMDVTLSWACTHPKGEAMTYDVVLMQGHRTEEQGYFSGELKSTGQASTTYAASGLAYNQEYSWKIFVHDASGHTRLGPVWYFTTRADTVPPSGTLTINNGATSTDSYSVTLGLTASDADSGLRGFSLSNDGVNWKAFTGLQQQLSWNIADPEAGGRYGLSSYTVSVRFQDNQDNCSPTYTATIAKTASSPGMILLKDKTFSVLQDALNAAQPGDTVYLTAGELTLSSYDVTFSGWGDGLNYIVGAIIPDGVTLSGEGAGKTTIRFTIGLTGLLIQNNAHVKGLTLIMDHPGYTYPAATFCGANSLIDSCVITSTGTGLWSHQLMSNCKIQRSCFVNCRNGHIHGSAAGNGLAFNNCTFEGCSGAFVLQLDENISITNSIIADSAWYGIGCADGVAFTISHSNVYNNVENYQQTPDQTGLNGNISASPMFVGSGDCSLQPGSPCINSGVDVGLPANGAPDMGAFEYGAVGSISVNANIPEAAFTIHGPTASYTGSGTNWSISGVPAGVYSISFTPVKGYYSPYFQAEILGHGQTVVFDGNYRLDTVAPTGDISVQYDIYAVAFPRVDIVLNVQDPVAGLGTGAQMQFSNDGTLWSPAEPFSSLKRDWLLSDFGGSVTPGTKTIYARVSDAFGNWTDSPLTDNILFVPNRRLLIVPDEYATVAEGLAAASPGDMVHIEPGVFTDQTPVPDGVRLQGAGPALTTLNGSTRQLGDNTMLDGCRMWSCQVYGKTAIVSNNVSTGGSWTVAASGANVIFRNNLFVNKTLGVLVDGATSAQLVNNTFVSINWPNTSSSIYAIALQNLEPVSRSTCVRNNIIAYCDNGINDNNYDRRRKLCETGFNCYWASLYSNACGYSTGNSLFGPGCFDGDPQFTNKANQDLTLLPSSPCIHSGDPDMRYSNVDATRNDRGYTGGPCANTAPVADFVAFPTTVAVGQAVQLDARLSGDRESLLGEMYFRWDFTNDGTFDTPYVNTPTSTTSFAHSGTYTVRVEVMDSGGFVAFATKTLEVIDCPPNPPSSPVPADGAVDIPVNTPHFSWTCSDPDPGQSLTYDVYFGTTPTPDLYASNISVSNVALPALQYNTFYFIQVVARDPEGLTTSGNLWSFVTEPVPVPDAPTSVTADALAWNQVNLNWDETTTGVYGFKIERSSAFEPEWRQVLLAPTPNTTDITVSSRTSYQYRIRAFNGTGDSPYSDVVSVTTPFHPWPSFAEEPQNTMAYTGTTSRLTVALDWSDPTFVYAWKHKTDTSELPVGSNSPQLSLYPVTILDAGEYWCDVTYLGTTHTSSTATLSVADHLEITQGPQSYDAALGETHTFSVLTSGGFPPLSYVWKHNGDPVGTDSTYAVTVQTPTDTNLGTYVVEVFDSNTDTIVSEPAILSANNLLPIGGVALAAILLGLIVAGGMALNQNQQNE